MNWDDKSICICQKQVVEVNPTLCNNEALVRHRTWVLNTQVVSVKMVIPDVTVTLY